MSLKGVLLLAVCFIACSSASFQSEEKSAISLLKLARLLGGDFTQLNEVFREIVLDVDTASLQIDPIDIALGFTGEVTLGEAFCSELEFIVPEGDFTFSGELLSSSPLPDFEAYELELALTNLNFKCFVETNVIVRTPTGGTLGGNDGFGTLVLKPDPNVQPVGAFITSGIDVFSPDFSQQTPQFFENSGCTANIASLDYSESEDLGSVTIIFIDVDITGIAIGILEDDPTIVLNPVQEELCKIVANLTDTVGDFVVNNIITNTTVNKSGVLDAENALVVGPEVDLLDIGDNVVTDLLFSNGSIFNDTLNSLLGNGSIAAVIGDLLGIDIGNGTGVDLDVVDIIEMITGEPYNSSTPLLNISFELFNETIGFELYVNTLQITTTDLDLDLSNLSFPGNQTVQLPTLTLGDVKIFADLRFVSEIPLLDLGFFVLEGLEFDETFNVDIEWDGFVFDSSAFIAIDLNAIPALQFGGVTSDLLSCLVSICVTPPVISALSVDSDETALQLSGFEDAIAVLLQDIVNEIYPMYEGTIFILIDSLFESLLVNEDLIEDADCPVADEGDASIPYDFSNGFFKLANDFLNEDLVNSILGLLIDEEQTSFTIINEPIELSFDIPQLGSDVQTVELILKELEFGTIPLAINDVDIFYADPLSPFFPQELDNRIDLGNISSPVFVEVSFDLNLFSGDPERRMLAPLEQANEVTLRVEIGNLSALLELYAKFSTYALESLPLSEILNLDCWVGRMDAGGGILNLDLLLLGLNITSSCDCELDLLAELLETISSPDSQAELQSTLNDLLQSLALILETPYTKENNELTLENANRRCNGLAEIAGDEGALESGSYVLAGILGGTLFSAVSLSLMLPRCCIKRKRTFSKLEREQEQEELESETSMFKNPNLSPRIRFGMPLLFLINVALFVIGDTDLALVGSIEGEILGIPIVLDGIAEFSVITSTQTLIDAGSYGLAIMIIAMAIVWPYLKMALLLFTWFAPPRIMSTNKRGILLSWIDTLGKWSLVEFYFIAIVLFAVSVDPVGSPELPFLPSGDIFFLLIVVELRRGIYVFSTAVLISLLLANVTTLQNAKIIRKMHPPDSSAKFSVAYSPFVNEVASGTEDHVIRTSARGRILFTVTITVLIGITLTLFSLSMFESSFIGLVGLLADADGVDTKKFYSVKEISQFLFTSDFQQGGYIFVTLVLLMTVIVIPIIQQLHLLYIFFRKENAAIAEKSIRTNEILTAWSCLEVYTLGLLMTSIEIKDVSKSLIDDECEPLVPTLEAIATAGLLSPEDADAACFAIEGTLSPVVFLFVFAVIITRFTTFLVLTLHEMASHQQKHKGSEGEYHNQRPARGYRILRILGLIETAPESSLDHPTRSSGLNPYPMENIIKSTPTNLPNSNPMFVGSESDVEV